MQYSTAQFNESDAMRPRKKMKRQQKKRKRQSGKQQSNSQGSKKNEQKISVTNNKKTTTTNEWKYRKKYNIAISMFNGGCVEKNKFFFIYSRESRELTSLQYMTQWIAVLWYQ